MTIGPSAYAPSAVRGTTGGSDQGAIPIVIAIDVEPDGRAIRPGGSMALDGLQHSVDRFERLRPRLEDATGRAVRFGWYLRMDPQIALIGGAADAIVRQGAASIDPIRARGDTLGLHTHAGRWDAARGGWVVDHGDASWIETCLRTGFAAFERTFGTPCREHRFGDRWTSPGALDVVAELGAIVDLTLEPGQRAVARVDESVPATGRIPSYLRVPRELHRHGSSPLWLVPLTAADPGPTMPTHRRLVRTLRYARQPRHRPLLLDRAWPSPEAYWSLVERTLDAQERPYLAFAIRSDLPLRPRVEGVDRILDELLRRPLVRRLAFTDGQGVVAAVAAR